MGTETIYNSSASPLLRFSSGISYPPYPAHHLHTHENCELYCLHRGSGHYVTDGSRHELKQGRIILMRPGEMHMAELTDAEAYENTVFHFSPSIVDSFDPERRLLAPFFDRPLGLHNVYDRSVLSSTDIYYLLKKCHIRQEDPYDNQIHSIGILIAILEQLKTLFDKAQYTNSSKESSAMHNVINYVNRNLTDSVTPEQICAEFSFSRAQLDRNFKNATGSTVWAYITAKRLLLARSYMREGMRATQAAAACGFQDYSTFYRSYAKHFGVTPTGVISEKDSTVNKLVRE
jgi:AraC-like DNA-binding protein